MKRHLPAILLVLCVAVFAGTIYMLLQWRFATGDVYPPYSSLRADPLGTMALYESLERFPQLTVTRDHQITNRLPNGEATTYLHLAARARDWDKMPADLVRVIEGFLAQGGRLVVTLTPQKDYWFGDPEEEDEKTDKEKKETEEKKDKDEKKKDKKAKEKDQKKNKASPSPSPEADAPISLSERWGLTLAPHSAKKDKDTSGTPIKARNVSGLPLPPELTWHGEMVISKPGTSWKTIYARGDEAVVAERTFGDGTMVVATDSYFVSNEAMLRDREPALLTWLVGPARTVVFDESHLGIVDSPGIATLARKYRLHGVVAALIVLALLFIWKNSTSLARSVPVPRATEETVAGRDAAAGFISLLRRNVPPDKLLDLCLTEWRRTFARSSKYSRREKEAVQAIVTEEQARPARERDPVGAYRRICAALQRGKTLN